MTATEHPENLGNSLDLREKSRYAASLRLSVAPMMDWTDSSRLTFVVNGLRWSGIVALHFRCRLRVAKAISA